LFVDEENVHMAKIESWKNKNIDGFYTKMTQKGGFSKLCAKIKKRCYTDLLHFSTRKHNLVTFVGRIVF
jgi:squalene cyclase